MSISINCQDGDDPFECGICLESYLDKDFKSEPRIFAGCGHTYCTNCIQSLLEAKKQCPVGCEKFVILASAKDYSINYSLKNLIDYAKKSVDSEREKKSLIVEPIIEKPVIEAEEEIKSDEQEAILVESESNEANSNEPKSEIKQEKPIELPFIQEEEMASSKQINPIRYSETIMEEKKSEGIIEKKIFKCALTAYSLENLYNMIEFNVISDELIKAASNGLFTYLLTKRVCGNPICILLFATYMEENIKYGFNNQKKELGDYELSWLNCENNGNSMAAILAKLTLKTLSDSSESLH